MNLDSSKLSHITQMKMATGAIINETKLIIQRVEWLASFKISSACISYSCCMNVGQAGVFLNDNFGSF